MKPNVMQLNQRSKGHVNRPGMNRVWGSVSARQVRHWRYREPEESLADSSAAFRQLRMPEALRAPWSSQHCVGSRDTAPMNRWG